LHVFSVFPVLHVFTCFGRYRCSDWSFQLIRPTERVVTRFLRFPRVSRFLRFVRYRCSDRSFHRIQVNERERYTFSPYWLFTPAFPFSPVLDVFDGPCWLFHCINATYTFSPVCRIRLSTLVISPYPRPPNVPVPRSLCLYHLGPSVPVQPSLFLPSRIPTQHLPFLSFLGIPTNFMVKLFMHAKSGWSQVCTVKWPTSGVDLSVPLATNRYESKDSKNLGYEQI
jgi:hypothetical protein